MSQVVAKSSFAHHIVNRSMIQRALALSLLAALAGANDLLCRDFYRDSLHELSGDLVKRLGAEQASRVVIPFELDGAMREAARSVTRNCRLDSVKVAVLSDFIVGSGKLGVTYDHAITRTAKETYERRSGNCVSLTNLFVALARASGLDARYAHVTEVERYYEEGADQEDSVIVHSTHICAALREGDHVRLISISPRPAKQYHTYRIIDDCEALAYFYNNRGFEIGSQVSGTSAMVARLREIECYQTAIRLEPSFYPAYNSLGTAFRRLGDNEHALQYYARALAINPHFAEAHTNRAAIYSAEGRWVDAVAELQQAVELNGTNPYVRRDLAKLYFALSRYAEAEGAYQKALSIEKDPGLYLGLARSRLALGKKDEAIDALTRALKLNPAHGESLSLLRALQKES